MNMSKIVNNFKGFLLSHLDELAFTWVLQSATFVVQAVFFTHSGFWFFIFCYLKACFFNIDREKNLYGVFSL